MAIVAFEAGYPNTAYTGSTALIALVHENKLYIANVGHSKAVLLSQTSDGGLKGVNVSQTHHI